MLQDKASQLKPSGAPALTDPGLLRSQAYIDGAWVDADDKATFKVNNPANNSILGTAPDMGVAETKRAIEAANAAWPAWRAKTAKERAGILRKWFDLILANQSDLAQIMTAEQGKPLTEANGEVVYGASFVEWFAEEGKRVYGDVIPQPLNDRRLVVIKQPIGVVAAITPWNFPNAMITRKTAPALAAGCPIVLKPAEQTPYSALALAVLAERAGFPKGVFNIVTCDIGNAPKVGGEMTGNPLVRKVTFTGSTEVGRLLMRQCSDQIKKVSLELGGNAPFIVFDDADLDQAVDGAIASKFRNAGQTCVCANRNSVPGYDVKHARRDACFRREHSERQRAQRRFLGRLQHHRATSRQRRAGFARDHGQREVPGRDGGDHADRLARHDDLRAGF